MGALDFYTTAAGPDLQTAFNTAHEHAEWEYGTSGFTGTIAEKDEVVLLDEPKRSEQDAEARAKELLDGDDPRISRKYGPAGALKVTTNDGEDGWLLFGVAAH
ncbi:hypothetical protein OG453_07025 [Streptomyces sp. NBC_01381]|uniref:hypothetical protein n=1 Tax=Streptomyces sp. NBC_01381 TaxID=2903845 RepID=UPI002258BF5E|nr:hypothetical protein [Streptomyces sp. NBC_01381]MCX4666420.1 hypothetical protein [Streptomyces sp. NBC_01381]